MPVASSGPVVSRGNQQPVFLAQGNGVIYIKIARKDLDGNDNTLSLQELNNLRIKFSDAGTVDYPIVNITEYPDYYLFQTSRVNVTSSADNNIKNYRFSASAYVPPISGFLLQDGEVWSGSGLFPSIDNLGYFNTSSAVYTFGDTPNIQRIIFTGSVYFTTGMTGDFGLYQNLGSPSTGPFQQIAVRAAAFPAGTSIVTGSFTPIEGYSYSFRINNESGVAITASNIEWQFTQSIAPQSSSNLTVLEPYLVENFNYSDCDVLMNNVDENQIGSFFRRVLYDDGSIIPSNFQEILSQSAEYAEVKDYNYTARAQILPRYDGVRTTSPDFNLNTITIDQYEGTRLNSLRTGDPNVQSLGTYFAYFDYLGGTTPELIGKAAAHILYLIGSDGTVQNPDISGLYYYNLIDSFESGKNANIILNTISGNPQTIGNIPIIRAGAIPMGIIASQTGSGYNVQNTMSFGTSTILVDLYASSYSLPYPYQQFPVVTGGSNTVLDLVSSISSTSNITLNTGTNTLLVNTSANNTQIALNLQGSMGMSQQYANPPYTTMNIHVYFQSSPNGTSWTTIHQAAIPLIYGQSTAVNITTPYFSPIAGNYYRAYAYNGSGYYSAELSNGTFNVVQQPVATSLQYITSSYWFTGSASKNVLTGSQFYLLYDTPNLHQQNYSGSGYFDFLNFEINPSDQIRFEGDELQVYTITNIVKDSGSFSLNLTLDRDIIDGTDLDSFLIRRLDPNPNYIVIDSDLTNYQGGGGFILPQYTTNELQANFDRIIKDLKEKGLIS